MKITKLKLKQIIKEALEELRNAIGNDSDLLEKMKQYVPPKILQQLIQKIAGQEKLTIGGVKYIS